MANNTKVRQLPCPTIILHTMGSSDQPLRTNDGGSAHMTEAFDVEADLPGELALLGILAAHDARRLEHASPTIYTDDNRLVLLCLLSAAKIFFFWASVQ